MSEGGGAPGVEITPKMGGRKTITKGRRFTMAEDWAGGENKETVDVGVAENFRSALETAFYEWWAENDHALLNGAPGDVLDLRLRLNAAFPNSRS